MRLEFEMHSCVPYADEDKLELIKRQGRELCRDLFENDAADKGVKGWLDPDHARGELELILKKAEEIRREADVFVLVGVGGSNQAARAMIEALQTGGPEIIYAGNTLSAYELRKILCRLEGKSVYLNVIAKNFETLEPGSHFRVLRRYLQSVYNPEELAKRIVLTGTAGSRLEEIADENGHMFLTFPDDVGGRYSAFSPVCLLPVAVAGLDVGAFLKGGRDMAKSLRLSPDQNTAVDYAAARNFLYEKGYAIEMLTSFEPRLSLLSRWWWQLFGESEGKDGLGIFPAFATYSEDLHSIGQYVQEGRRFLMQTCIRVEDPGARVTVEPDAIYKDGFDYLDGKDFADINRLAQEATLNAHVAGEVPTMLLSVPRIDEEAFGGLYYFFMVSCAVSGKLLGVNPFDQPGVEAYKRNLFRALGHK